ncbi:uncharacterized protein LOC114527224 [Dendronephthya gigantea]|uniref:uncharacterized protein LOC114527224 n=1 Tax=Dendronephthya gigantea TaxID=151771 RepID=UPI00106B8813|nr:uncharacterized protein LOC114527224 [Dendronephthya gigantea]
MLEFIMDNPVLWNVKMTDYRRKDKKEKIWEEQAHQMNKTVDILKGWFRSLRDTNIRLDKKKSGDSAPNLTKREQWILSKFAFLKTVTRHRPEPMQSVKETIQLHRGDLNAAESACADMQDVLDEVTPIPSSTAGRSHKRPQDTESDVLETLHKRVAESGTILKDIYKAKQQPITARSVFANYVKESLLTMSKSKYKKARSSINRLLSELMDEDSDDEFPSAMAAPSIKVNQQEIPSQPPHDLHPTTSIPFCSFRASAPSFSEHYQKPSNMPINMPLASLVRGSQPMEYMQQFHQRLFQYPHHHKTTTKQQQMIPPSQQLAQQPFQQTQQQCTPTSGPVRASLASATELITETSSPTPHSPSSAFEQSHPNITSLSGFRDIMESTDDIGFQDEVLNLQPPT